MEFHVISQAKEAIARGAFPFSILFYFPFQNFRNSRQYSSLQTLTRSSLQLQMLNRFGQDKRIISSVFFTYIFLFYESLEIHNQNQLFSAVDPAGIEQDSLASQVAETEN